MARRVLIALAVLVLFIGLGTLVVPFLQKAGLREEGALFGWVALTLAATIFGAVLPARRCPHCATRSDPTPVR